MQFSKKLFITTFLLLAVYSIKLTAQTQPNQGQGKPGGG